MPLEAEVPKVDLYLGMSKGDQPEPLLYAVAATTSQGWPAERSDGSVQVDSCRPQSCDEKGLIWASNDGVVVGAMIHFFYQDPKVPARRSLLIWSSDASLDTLPHGFVMALTEWLRQPASTAGFSAIRMVGPGGSFLDVPPERLLP
ncbi:hypothetical protein [Dyella sp. 333MFSha]|uniref:hypothetical protein n=1 Tax=Dyella sp. 333MFSha TaxID=1798240 RepID=UPI000B86AEF8|nr:hypothetical protein [Dyella sp. 333MFSha]